MSPATSSAFYQLDLFDGARPAPFTAASLLAELHRRGGAGVRSLRLKHNRRRLLSLSRDGTILHLHACFVHAPAEVVDAIARFATAERGSARLRSAAATLRAWGGPRSASAELREGGGVPAPALCCGTPAQQAFLRTLYARLNATRFGNRLPEDLPLRFSDRMSSRFGHVRYYRHADGRRSVIELALNIHLLARGNDAHLLDTMLHEMAHVQAWLRYGHRHHGARWKRICLEIGCIPRACAQLRLRRRRRPVDRVPRLPEG